MPLAVTEPVGWVVRASGAGWMVVKPNGMQMWETGSMRSFKLELAAMKRRTTGRANLHWASLEAGGFAANTVNFLAQDKDALNEDSIQVSIDWRK